MLGQKRSVDWALATSKKVKTSNSVLFEVTKFLYVYDKLDLYTQHYVLGFLIGNSYLYLMRDNYYVYRETSDFDGIKFTVFIYFQYDLVTRLNNYLSSVFGKSLLIDLSIERMSRVVHLDKFSMVLKQINSLGYREYWWSYIDQCFFNLIWLGQNKIKPKFSGYPQYMKAYYYFIRGYPMKLIIFCLNRALLINSYQDMYNLENTVTKIGSFCVFCRNYDCFCSLKRKDNDDFFVSTNQSNGVLDTYKEYNKDMILSVFPEFDEVLMAYKNEDSSYILV